MANSERQAKSPQTFYATTTISTFIGTPEYLQHKKKRFKSLDHDVAKSEAFTIEDLNVRKQFETEYLKTSPLYYRGPISREIILRQDSQRPPASVGSRSFCLTLIQLAAKRLAQIDAVFVTVEPNGGSHKPCGQPFPFHVLEGRTESSVIQGAQATSLQLATYKRTKVEEQPT